MPSHFRPDGQAKQSFETKAAAQREGKLRGKTAYSCDFCGLWHIGGRA